MMDNVCMKLSQKCAGLDGLIRFDMKTSEIQVSGIQDQGGVDQGIVQDVICISDISDR